MARFPANAGQLIPLEYKNFKGYNIVDDPSTLPPGYLVSGSYDIDLTRQRGALARRPGLEAVLLTSLGAGGVKGLHNYKRSSGDRILFVHGNDWYKLAGDESTLTKTLTADFDAGTFDANKLTTASDEVKSIATGSEAVDQSQLSEDDSVILNNSGGNTSIGQTFIPSVTWLSAITFNTSLFDNTESCKVSVYDGPSKTTLLGQTTAVGGTLDIKAVFEERVKLTVGVTHYFEITPIGAADFRVYYIISGAYTNGNLYINGASHASKDLKFQTHGAASFYTAVNSEPWVSPVYDLGSIPVSATFTWADIVPSTTTLTLRVRGSNDNVNWGDWHVAESSGKGIPLARYVQVKQEFTTEGGDTPSVQDFTITYETALNQAVSIKNSLSGNKGRMVTHDDECYLAESGRPQVYDGSNVYPVGIDAPGSAPTIAAGGGTGLTGVYKACVTFTKDNGAESNAGATSGAVTVANKDFNWSAIPVGATGTRVTGRKLYRTEADGDTFYLVHTLENNTDTTYTGDNLADAVLITNPELETDNDVPPDSIIIAEHKDYMLYVPTNDPSKLRFSKRGLPDSCPILAEKPFPGPIRAVGSYNDACVVEGDAFAAAVFGDIWDKDVTTPVDNTTTRIISKEHGAVSHESMFEVFGAEGDQLVFPTRKGFYHLNPGFYEGSLRSIPLSRSVQPLFDGAVNRQNMAGIFHDNCGYLALNYYGSDAPVHYNNIVMVIDMQTREWLPPWRMDVSGFAEMNGNLYVASSTEGQIYKLTGSDDDGSDIHSIAKLPVDYTPLGASVKKRFAELQVVVAAGSDTTSLQLKPAVDSVSNTLTPGATNNWNGKLLSPRQRIQLGRGYEYQLTVEDNSQLDWIISKLITMYERGE